jgi:replicative DNA helicase
MVPPCGNTVLASPGTQVEGRVSSSHPGRPAGDLPSFVEPAPPVGVPNGQGADLDPRLQAFAGAWLPPPAQAGPGMGAPTPPVGSGDGWQVNVDGRVLAPRSTIDVLGRLGDKVTSGHVAEYQPIALGFTPLDKSLGGGVRVGELLLIGGAQGTGKTTLSLQMARNIALAGQADVLYICFEHDDEYLLNRLIALESAIDGLPNPSAAVRVGDVRREILATWLAQGGGGAAELVANPRLRASLDRINRYGQSLFLMRGSQTTTTVDNLRRLVEAHHRTAPERQLVVFVDYLQKVPVIPDPASETERVTVVVNGLKDVALAHGVAVVSIVAADKEGLKASRLRSHHLRGSSAINYEADVILILNEKYSIVAKVNIEFNPYQAQRFRDWIVLTIEKNRSGQHSVDLEFQKYFAHACFDPTGRTVQEKLIEERLYND